LKNSKLSDEIDEIGKIDKINQKEKI